jgi:two-component system sensor histidine kinase DctS
MSAPPRIAAALRAARSPAPWVWVLPNLVLGVFVVALYVLLVLLDRQETETERHALARDVQWAEQAIRRNLEENQDFLHRLARGIADGTVARESFLTEAERYVAVKPELLHVAWVDADQVVGWVAPFETATWNGGERLSQVEQTLAFQRAQRTSLPAYGVPGAVPDEPATIELYVPALDDRRLLGAVVAVYSAEGLLRHVAPEWFVDKYRVVLETDERILGASSAVEVASDVTDTVRLDPPGHGLRLRVSAFVTHSRVPIQMLVLVAAGLVLLMAWSLWALSAHMRRRLRAETDRQRAEDALRRETAFRRAMEESVLTGLRAVDLEGRIIYANPAFCAMVGFSEEELVGRLPPFPYWPEEELATLHDITRRWLRGEAPRGGFEVRIQRKGGERLYARMYISPLVDGDGRQTGWMGSMVDISEQKRAQQQQERLQHTSRLVTMGEMASSLAHELNQPLSAVANYCMGSVNRLRSDTASREEVLAAMEKAAFQAERAGKIVRRMREFAYRREPRRAAIGVAEVVDEALGFVAMEARKAGIALRVDVPAALPAVYADRILVEQVVLNLVKNGIEAMRQEGARGEIVISARENGGGAVEVAVADRGPGIPAADAERLFAPFFTTKPEGMGMGLGICRSIVEYHDGRLWAGENPGGGSVFRFTLPLAAAREASG